MHAVERPVEAIVCKFGRGREMQRTDTLARPAPVCKRDEKELSNTFRNRSRNGDRVSRGVAYLPNPFQIDVGGS